ncbi:hypothetical protein THUN1379_07460 [Paludibacterium sp. THUN1379]|uniref:SPOR domain-containing protein n=1 Tax=Paludibacterium sp. THUN1379 TaxID=3112107 RepID=UPI003093BC3D|nr:hypothetical protein THUN1379_07460 [Paludibacterium sp. THUN1379]
MAGLSAQEELLLMKKRARRRLVGAIVLVLIATVVLWKVLGRVQDQPMRPESVLVVGVASGGTQTAPGAKAPAARAAASAPQDASRPEATALPESLSTLSEPVNPAVAARSDGSAPHVTAAARGKEASAAVHRKPAEASAAHGKPARPKTPDAKPHKAVDPAAILEGRADGADSVAAAKPSADGSKYVIQLAALSDPAKADALKAKLAGLGVDARFSKVQTSKGPATRVRVGPFASRSEANAVLRKLANAGVSGIVVGQ